MKTIFLIELFWTGHHPTYLKLFTKTLLELGCRVVVLCPKPNEITAWIAVNCAEKSKFIEVFEYINPELCHSPSGRIKSIIMTLRRWMTASAAVREILNQTHILPDIVYFMYLDVYLNKHLLPQFVDFIFPYKWSGLYFAPTHLRLPAKNMFSKLSPMDPDSLLRARYCQFISILDEGIADKLQSRLGMKPVVVFPDVADVSLPVCNYSLVNDIRKKAGKRITIGLFGHLDKRKGLLTLVEIVQRSVDENYFFVIAGKFNLDSYSRQELDKIKMFVSLNYTNCFTHFNFIPDEPSFNSLISCCDILFAAYEKFYSSSNLLTKAAFFHKYVIVSEGYCMAERTIRYELGAIVKESNVGDCINAIRHISNKLQNKEQYEQPNFKGYITDNSTDQLKHSFAAMLDLV